MGFFDSFLGLGEVFSCLTSLVQGLGKLLVEAVKVIASVFTEIGKALGLIEEDFDEEEFGDKALQAEEEGSTPDRFESYDEYFEAIKNFELDPEKSEKYTEKEKLDKAVEVRISIRMLYPFYCRE